MGVVAADVNRDGRVDLYVANDMCPHFLFLNRGDGTFEDVTDSSGAAVTESGQYQGGMGVDVEDLDGDGFPELFVTNFDGEYNTIHRTTDGRNFEDVSAATGIVRDSMPDVGWGCALADLDNDGWPDMLTVNGHVYDNLALLGRDGDFAQRPKVWRNRGRAGSAWSRTPGRSSSRSRRDGAAFGDLDNDGDIDVVINRIGGLPAVLLNESQPAHWIRLELSGTRSNRSAIGTAVAVHAGGRVLHRQVKGGELCIDQRPQAPGRCGEGRSGGAGRDPLAQRPEYDADRPRAWPYSPGRRTDGRGRRPSATNRGRLK